MHVESAMSSAQERSVGLSLHGQAHRHVSPARNNLLVILAIDLHHFAAGVSVGIALAKCRH